MRLIPRTLFGQTAVTVTVSLLTFLLIALGSAVYFIAIPMAKRSADDFAAIIVAAAHTMEDLPGERHADYRQQLLLDHGLIVADQKPALAEKKFDVPYYVFFRESLARRVGSEVPIVESTSGPLIWVDVTVHDKTMRIGFDRGRLGTSPYLVLVMAALAGAVLTWLISVLAVRRIQSPLLHLSSALQQVGRGNTPPQLAESGPAEIVSLARAFNHLSADLQELAENRTVIVAGISHDLRTPLTRLGIAIEMLAEDSDQELVAGIRRDLDVMNNLISQFLDFSKGLEESNPTRIDLRRIIDDNAADLRRQDIEVKVSGCKAPCWYFADAVALERLLTNLLENAARHGGGAPVDIELRCDQQAIAIRICDRGPGIPPDQLDAVFRPFLRLESGRSSKTGGSGLGLAIARQLAIKHGWTIELLPRPGGGTVAKVGLPIAG